MESRLHENPPRKVSTTVLVCMRFGERPGSGGPSRSTSSLNFVTEIPVDAGGVDPEGRSAFHLQQFRLGVVVPVDGDSVLFHFSVRSCDADADLRSFLPEAGKNDPRDSVKYLPGVAR